MSSDMHYSARWADVLTRVVQADIDAGVTTVELAAGALDAVAEVVAARLVAVQDQPAWVREFGAGYEVPDLISGDDAGVAVECWRTTTGKAGQQ